MKRFIALTLLCTLITGCQLGTSVNTDTTQDADDVTYWVDYYLTQCNAAPWGDTLNETTIIDYYQATLGVVVMALEVNAPSAGFISCQACGCATGTIVSLQTDAAGKTVLLEHGFLDVDILNYEPVTDPIDTVVNNTAADLNISATELVDPAVVTSDPVLSETDAALQVRAEQLQITLASYYVSHGSYPDTLADLNRLVPK